ncbi:DNA polymerase IV [Candidatus Nitrospira bockiana]
MDAFFAAIEERDSPWLRGRPVVVGADPRQGKGRGVVSTANYHARAYGIHSAMPISRAWRLSVAAAQRGDEPATFLPVDMPNYRRVSDRIFDLLKLEVPVVEPASIDEAYLELSRCGSYEAATELCRRIKEKILNQEQLTASVGIGPNKLIAKIASGVRKPDGLTVVIERDAERFLAGLPLRAIPGIGPKTELELARQGFHRVEDLKRLPRGDLEARFGKRGGELYAKLRAHDESPVSPDAEIKSIGEQETFDHDTRAVDFLIDRLAPMCRRVLAALADDGFSGFRTVVLIVRFADFETKSRRRTLATPGRDVRTLQAEAIKLLLPFLDRRENPQGKPLRLIGVRVEHLLKPLDALAPHPTVSDPVQATLWP